MSYATDRQQKQIARRPFPLGKFKKPHIMLARAANRPKHLIMANRYPGQIIGVGIRLPEMNEDTSHLVGMPWPCHLYLSIVWAKPSRWWKWSQAIPLSSRMNTHKESGQ